MKLIVGLCEGPHDVAFLGRILLANGFQLDKVRVEEYPMPINGFIKNAIMRSAMEVKGIEHGITSYEIPRAIYKKEKTRVCLHAMGGDNRTDLRKNLIDSYKKMIRGSELEGNTSNIDSITFLVFYDADDKGVEKRLTEIKDNFCEEYNIESKNVSQGRVIPMGDKYKFGCYIFFDSSSPNKTGTLEDIILNIMRKNDEEIMKSTESYLGEGRKVLLRDGSNRDKEYDSLEDKYGGSHKYHEKKSIISAAGQLQFSGMGNNVIILKSDYIKREDIITDSQCKKIGEMFQ